MKFKYYIFFFTLLLSRSGICQEKELSDVILTIAEELASDESDPEAVSIFIDKLYDLSEDPVRINSANREDISRLFFLTEFQVKALIDYINSSGKLVSVYEIGNIPGFDKEIARMMMPFISLNDRTGGDMIQGKWRNTLLTNISVRSGLKDTSAPGSPVRILSKYGFSTSGFSGGFSIEKDPGEKFLSGNPPHPDFLSFHLAYKGNGFIKKIIIGDFSARFGMGTNLNTGIRTGISLTSPGNFSPGNEIRQYTSTDENSFFRGMAAEFSLNKFSLSFFYSRNEIDATIRSSNDSLRYAENFYRSGLHNSPTLLLKKDVLTDQSSGINLSYNFKKNRAGVIWSEDRLSLPVISQGADPAGIYEFSGNRNSLYSLYYNSQFGRIMLFGELSINESFRYAIVQALSIKLSDRLSADWLFRYYEPGYSSLHGKGPGSSSTTWNERSIRGNFTFEAARHLFISAGCELRQFLWLKYRCSSPSTALRNEIRIKYLPSENIAIEALLDQRSSMDDNPEITGIPDLRKIISYNTRGSVRYSPYENIAFGTRIDYKIVNHTASTGMALIQDASFSFRRLPVTFWIRYCLFNTDTWDSRIYTYENDLLHSFSIPALSGEGSRSYLMVKYDAGDIGEIRIKYGITSLLEEKVIENKEEFKFQIRLFF